MDTMTILRKRSVFEHKSKAEGKRDGLECRTASTSDGQKASHNANWHGDTSSSSLFSPSHKSKRICANFALTRTRALHPGQTNGMARASHRECPTAPRPGRHISYRPGAASSHPCRLPLFVARYAHGGGGFLSFHNSPRDENLARDCG